MNEPETNGVDHASDGAITISLRLTPTRQGYGLLVTVDPADVLPDTVIEACGRTIRAFERLLGAQATVQIIQGSQTQVTTLHRERERIRRIFP